MSDLSFYPPITRAGAAGRGAANETIESLRDSQTFVYHGHVPGQWQPDGSMGFVHPLGPLHSFRPFFPVTAAKDDSDAVESSIGPTRSTRRVKTRTTSQMSSLPSRDFGDDGDDSTGVLRKSDLSEPDKENFNRAFDLLVIEILTKIGWDSPKFNKYAKECLSQVCAESDHETRWNDDIGKLFVTELQTFRGKIAQAADKPARKFRLSEIVDPDNKLPVKERGLAIVRYRESILNPNRWKEYFLHYRDPESGFGFFANPTFCDFHVGFWYGNSSSPVSHQDEVKLWSSTPLDMLATSACALTYGLRRATSIEQPKSKSTSQRRAMRFSKSYNRLQELIKAGMKGILNYPDEIARNRFQHLLLDLHQRGLKLLDEREPDPVSKLTTFYLPPVEEFRAAFSSLGHWNAESQNLLQSNIFFSGAASSASGSTSVSGLGLSLGCTFGELEPDSEHSAELTQGGTAMHGEGLAAITNGRWVLPEGGQIEF